MTTKMAGPPDGGWGWMCAVGRLYCCFITLGLTSAFGVIYVELIDSFNSTREEAAWIGSLCLGVSLMSSPVSSVLTSRLGIQKTTALGTLIAFSGCLISCFATGIPYLYISYGVLMGLGLGILMVPPVLIVLQYFNTRIGLANAIGSTGNGLGTLVLPPLYTYLMEEYGWRGTLLLLSGIILNGLVCAFIFIPPKYLEASNSSTSLEKTKLNFCRNLQNCVLKPCTLLYVIALMIGTFGYSIPFLHLPDMAMQIGIEKYQAAYLISTIGIAGIFGRIVFGFITDFPTVNVLILQVVSLMVCGAVTAVCPHLTEFYALAVYSVIYGIFIGVFISTIPLAILKLVGLDRAGDFMGIAYCLCGILHTMASPAAGWLFDFTQSYNASFYVAAGVFIVGGVFIISVSILNSHGISSQKENLEIIDETVAPSQIGAQGPVS